MSHTVSAPLGLGLPYSSLFDIPRATKPIKEKARPSQYFWDKATSAMSSLKGSNEDPNWLDVEVPPISEFEDELSGYSYPRAESPKPSGSRRFHRLRHISFRSFIPRAGSKRNSTVVATEVVSKQKFRGENSSINNFTLFKSWKIKSRGNKNQASRLTAAIRHRISSKSPPEKHPKSWQEYHTMYASDQLDILDPPPPPPSAAPQEDQPTPFEAKKYFAPRPANEPVRQLVVNRLGLFGPKHYDPSEAGAELEKARLERVKKLESEGKIPTSLDMSWDTRSALSSDGGFGLEDTQQMMKGVRDGQLPPETLEQHPVFRKIVRECREVFATSASFLAVLDDDHLVFLAESGLDGMRGVPRDVSFCSHTILSGNKGFTILDTMKDWRFENSPLTQDYSVRFYAGVPLLAPNLDGSGDTEQKACPIGTLCVVDSKPRDSFGIEERKKLVYMGEYARREIEKWFLKKMDQKMKNLEASQQLWQNELTRANNSRTEDTPVNEELLSDIPTPTADTPSTASTSLFQRTRAFSGRAHSRSSTVSTTPTSVASHADLPKSPAGNRNPSLFDDFSAVVTSKRQKVFDLATKLVGDTLDLSLVYLIAVAPNRGPEGEGQTMVVSGYNMPLPPPSFDFGLHLSALTVPEGGLLYQNPSVHEALEAKLNPKMSSAQGTSTKAAGYTSAMLLAVSKDSRKTGGGFILAGFTDDSKRVFGGEDVAYMKQFAHELSKYTMDMNL